MAAAGSRAGELSLAVAGALVAAGLAICAAGHWRFASLLMGIGLGVAAVARLLLPKDRAGMLMVRSRATDVIILGGLSAAVLLLGGVTPS